MLRWLLIILIFSGSGCSNRIPLQLGSTRVLIVREEHGAGKSFIHLHQNETTALKAAQHIIRKAGGSLMTIVHPGERTIVFKLHGKRYEFDPNRMFSDAGIKKTLKLYGSYTPAAHRIVKNFSDIVKSLLPDGPIIAVHNNKDYCIRDYLPGHSMARDAGAIFLDPHANPRNFYVLTQRQDYLNLNHYNRVLQAHNATDDGSLSVYLSNRKYINVEAGYDQLSAQIAMLQRISPAS